MQWNMTCLKLFFIWDQTCRNTFYLQFLTNFWMQHMASGWVDEFPGSSDEEEEEFFAGKSAKWDRIAKHSESKNYFAVWMKRLMLSLSNNLRKAQGWVFADDGGEESSESGDEETVSNTDSEDALPNPLQWSNTFSRINVEEFCVCHGPSRNIGDNATVKCFLIFSSTTNSLINRLAQLCLCTFKGRRNVRSQLSRNFSISRPQYFDWNPRTSTGWYILGFWSIYWSQGLQKNHPQAAFCNAGLADPNSEDLADLLCKACPLVTLLEQKFSEVYTPGKSITVDEELVKFNNLCLLN